MHKLNWAEFFPQILKMRKLWPQKNGRRWGWESTKVVYLQHNTTTKQHNFHASSKYVKEEYSYYSSSTLEKVQSWLVLWLLNCENGSIKTILNLTQLPPPFLSSLLPLSSSSTSYLSSRFQHNQISWTSFSLKKC